MVLPQPQLPEVIDALNPFLKSRKEVANIRRELQQYLHGQLDHDGPRLSAVTALEQELSDNKDVPPALSGVRKAYWKALQAHTAAQAKYDALKADLQQLRSPASQDTITRFPPESVNDGFIPLLRSVETLRKLQVIDAAFYEISSTGNAFTSNSIETVIRRQTGEPPVAPATEVAPYRQGPNVEARILELKKAVLSTKHSVDHVRETCGGPLLQTSPIPRGEVAGLQSALNELTGWMETQLTFVGEAEANAQSSPGTSSSVQRATPDPLSLEDITNLYDLYLGSRENLIHTVNTPSSLETPDPVTLFASSTVTQSRTVADKRRYGSEQLLPYISALTAAKQREEILLQQSFHLRRQIAAAEGHTESLITRLADESHLVQPGAARGKDWAGAAAMSSTETGNFVRERLEMGERSILAATKAVDDINAVPRLMDGLSDR